jgi:hypothetical protein
VEISLTMDYVVIYRLVRFVYVSRMHGENVSGDQVWEKVVLQGDVSSFAFDSFPFFGESCRLLDVETVREHFLGFF